MFEFAFVCRYIKEWFFVDPARVAALPADLEDPQGNRGEEFFAMYGSTAFIDGYNRSLEEEKQQRLLLQQQQAAAAAASSSSSSSSSRPASATANATANTTASANVNANAKANATATANVSVNASANVNANATALKGRYVQGRKPAVKGGNDAASADTSSPASSSTSPASPPSPTSSSSSSSSASSAPKRKRDDDDGDDDGNGDEDGDEDNDDGADDAMQGLGQGLGRGQGLVQGRGLGQGQGLGYGSGQNEGPGSGLPQHPLGPASKKTNLTATKSIAASGDGNGSGNGSSSSDKGSNNNGNISSGGGSNSASSRTNAARGANSTGNGEIKPRGRKPKQFAAFGLPFCYPGDYDNHPPAAIPLSIETSSDIARFPAHPSISDHLSSHFAAVPGQGGSSGSSSGGSSNGSGGAAAAGSVDMGVPDNSELPFIDGYDSSESTTNRSIIRINRTSGNGASDNIDEPEDIDGSDGEDAPAIARGAAGNMGSARGNISGAAGNVGSAAGNMSGARGNTCSSRGNMNVHSDSGKPVASPSKSNPKEVEAREKAKKSAEKELNSFLKFHRPNPAATINAQVCPVVAVMATLPLLHSSSSPLLHSTPPLLSYYHHLLPSSTITITTFCYIVLFPFNADRIYY